MSDHREVITVHSDDSDNNYVPRLPEYERDSPGQNPVQETEGWNPMPGEEAPDHQVFSNILSDSRNTARDAIDTSERPRSPLRRGSLMQRVFPFLRV